MKLDRRNSPRFFCRNQVSIRIERDPDHIYPANLQEISLTGIKLFCEELLPLGTPLTITDLFGVAGPSLQIKLVEVRSASGYSVGIGEFLALNSEQQAALDRFIAPMKKVVDRRHAAPATETDRRLTNPLFLKCLRFNRGEKLIEKNQYFYFRELQSGSTSRVCIRGREMLNLASNNYLGLSTHPSVIEASIKAIERYGIGTGGSRILSGTMDLHNELEEKIARFKGGEACAVFSTGYTANLGIISTLVSRDEHLIIDAKSHASIIDGCRLSGARLSVFRHNNMKNLATELEKIAPETPKLIITDGVFSMDGDVAKLDEIYRLARMHQAAIMVDDAHGLGVLGKTGRGTIEHFQLEPGAIDLVMGTLSKALGALGGFVIAKRKVIHCLKNISRSILFTTSFPPAICAAAIAALEVMETEPEWRHRLWENICFLKNNLKKAGFDIGETHSAIIPVIIRDEILTYQITQQLEDEGIFISPVAYPAVRRKESRLRGSLMATHTIDDLEFFIDRLLAVCRRVGYSPKPRDDQSEIRSGGVEWPTSS